MNVVDGTCMHRVGNRAAIECGIICGIRPITVFSHFNVCFQCLFLKYNHGKRFEIDGYATDYFAEEASKAIRANRNRPFFLYFSPSAIHSPLQARKEDYDRLSHIPNHCDRVYAAMIVAADRAVGRVLETLRNEGLEDDTLVLLSSDNGAPNMVSRPGVNAPFRGWKATFFEGV